MGISMANSKRLCTGCKVRFPTDELMSLPAGKFHSIDCAAEYGRVKSRKIKKKREDKEHNQRKRKLKDDDRGFQLKKTQTLFNRFIRLRDDLLPCISCGRHHSGQYHAGHYRSVGAAPELRFEETNCHKQCAPCNNHLSGNPIEYRVGLIKKIGIEMVEIMEGPHPPKRYTLEQLKYKQKYYSQKIKELDNV